MPVAIATIGDMLVHGEPRTRQLRFRKKSGEYGIAEILISPQREGSTITGIIGIARDITHRKRDEDELLALTVGINASNDAIIGKSLDGRITSWNKGAEKLYGYTAEEAIGKSIHFFVPNEKISEIDSALALIRQGKTVEPYETERISKNGRIVQISLNHFPIRNSAGELVGSAAVARDITATKETIRKLVTLEKDLELEKAKEGFVSMAAHQLRTPLTAIQGYTEMLSLGDAGPLNEKQKEYLQEVFQANKRMIELINALLDVSRIDFGTFSISPVPADIRAIAETQLHELEAQIAEKKLTVIKHCEDAPKEMLLDPKLTGIIFQNLLSNAVKYTPPGGTITCSIAQCAPNICITISDSGIGIPESQKPKIFSKLFRADNAMVTDPGGTGLGLYIVKAILEKSGGSISFTSQEGVGTKFELYLPIIGMKAHKGTKQLSS